MKLDLRFDEVFPNPIDAVWHAVTDPLVLARWLMDNDFEPRAGHKFTLRDPPTTTWRGRVECEVLEIDPPHRMVWSWNGGSQGEIVTRVIFELRPEGSGTRFVLRHEGETNPEQAESLGSGWTRKLGVLRHVLGPDYARRIGFRATPEQVFDAIATIDGLRAWWTTIVSGSAAKGGDIRFGFEGLEEQIIMHVETATRPKSIHWTCMEHTALEDWNATKIAFEIAPRGVEGCELSFRHLGLTPKLECYEMCEGGWDHFLASLVAYVDEGKGTPFGAPKPRPSRRKKT